MKGKRKEKAYSFKQRAVTCIFISNQIIQNILSEKTELLMWMSWIEANIFLLLSKDLST